MIQGKGPCLIVGNGRSAASADLQAVRCPVWTCNAAWSLRWMPDLHIALDRQQMEQSPAVYRDLHDAGRLVVAGDRWPIGKNVGFLQDGSKWSRDPWNEGIVEGWHGTGSVVYAALQLAIGAGWGPVYIVGLDLSGPRFDGSKAAPTSTLSKQDQLFRYAAQVNVVNVFNCNPMSACTAFPKVSWEKALEGMNWMYPERESSVLPAPAMAWPQ